MLSRRPWCWSSGLEMGVACPRSARWSFNATSTPLCAMPSSEEVAVQYWYPRRVLRSQGDFLCFARRRISVRTRMWGSCVWRRCVMSVVDVYNPWTLAVMAFSIWDCGGGLGFGGESGVSVGGIWVSGGSLGGTGGAAGRSSRLIDVVGCWRNAWMSVCRCFFRGGRRGVCPRLTPRPYT